MTMAKLAPPKKASKPNAPKKPSTRSKTGNAACSEAASNWQLSLRGKASLDPETYRTLAKCRAMNRTAKMAEAQGRTGKLSAMGEQAVKARLQARFDSGLITQKARTERLDMLLKQRSQRGEKAQAKPAKLTREQRIEKISERIEKSALNETGRLEDNVRAMTWARRVARLVPPAQNETFPSGPELRRSARLLEAAELIKSGQSAKAAERISFIKRGFAPQLQASESATKFMRDEQSTLRENVERQKNLTAKRNRNRTQRLWDAREKLEKRVATKQPKKVSKILNARLGKIKAEIARERELARNERAASTTSTPVLVQRGTDSGGGEMIPPKPAQPARYSLGGKLAPGRGKDAPEYRERLERVTDRAKKYVYNYDRGFLTRPKTSEYGDRVKSLRSKTIPALHEAHTSALRKERADAEKANAEMVKNDAIPLAMKPKAPKGFESIIIPSSKSGRIVVSAKPIKGNKQVSVQKLSRGGYAALDTESGMLLNVGSVSMKGAERYGRAAEYLLKRAEKNTGKKLKFSDFARDKSLNGYWKTLMSIQGNRRLK